MNTRGVLLTVGIFASLLALFSRNANAIEYPNPDVDADADRTEWMNTQIEAFLRVLREHESNNRYDVLYGGQTFDDFSAHPAARGWKGVQLPDAWCRQLGLGAGCVSTAAGAYQFIRPTWARFQASLKLPDFSPESQDKAALAYCKELGVIDALETNDVVLAFRRSSKAWASMPFSAAGQPKSNLAQVLDEFQDFGGTYA